MTIYNQDDSIEWQDEQDSEITIEESVNDTKEYEFVILDNTEIVLTVTYGIPWHNCTKYGD